MEFLKDFSLINEYYLGYLNTEKFGYSKGSINLTNDTLKQDYYKENEKISFYLSFSDNPKIEIEKNQPYSKQQVTSLLLEKLIAERNGRIFKILTEVINKFCSTGVYSYLPFIEDYNNVGKPELENISMELGKELKSILNNK